MAVIGCGLFLVLWGMVMIFMERISERAIILAGQPVSAGAQSRSPNALSTQQKVVLSYFHDVLDGRKIGLLENLFLPDCVIYRPEGIVKGMAGIRGVVERNIAAYSKFETEVDDVFEAGDRVVVRITHRAMGGGVLRSRIGTHDLRDKPVAWGAIAIFRMQHGKIAEEWVNRDELGILLSLGVLKPSSDVR
jgi:hypothetical protein